MNKDNDMLKLVFKYLIGKDEFICRLCLTSIQNQNQKVSLDDCVKIEKPYIQDVLTYFDMFEDLGLEQEPLLPQMLCVGCAATIANAYLFKRLTAYYNEKWTEFFSKISNTLEQTKTISESVKTVYLVVNEKQNVILTSQIFVKGKKKVLHRMKQIIKYRKTYGKIKKKSSDRVCEECGQKFKTNIMLWRHHAKEHSNVRYPCSLCPKVTTSPKQLEGHMIRVHHPKKFQCPKCEKMFSTERLLAYHDRSYHKAVICKLCFVQFPSKRELRSHLDKHDVNNCLKCGKSFYNRQTFKAHVKSCGIWGHKQLKFFCDICSKGYVHKTGIRSHLKIDHGFGVNMHSCKWCSKKFDAASKLKNHLVIHTRERNFHCEHCGNKFVTQAALVYHIRLHTGERPFPCDLCEETFLSASRRMEHKHRKHFGPTKECPICHMKFILRNQLNKHLKRHYNPHSKLYVPVPNNIER